MNTDICKLLYPSRIYCFRTPIVYTEKLSCYQVAVVTLFWPQKRKLDAKYSTIVRTLTEDQPIRPGLHIVVMVVSTVANMFLTLF